MPLDKERTPSTFYKLCKALSYDTMTDKFYNFKKSLTDYKVYASG